MMKKVFLALTLSAFFFACQKQQTDKERRAEVDREVQQRLAAEHQREQADQLAQREAEVNAREQTQEKQAAAARTRATLTPAHRAIVESAGDREPTGSYSIFYTKLEPYGDWIETRDYGYVYRPREATSSHWRPYTNGHWVYTDAGWTWISDEPFGWATYHYGRWTRLRGVGWIWVPGDEWAPAWVSWRKGGEFVGWAPLPPEARFDRRRGIQNWSDSYYDVGPDQYVFVPTQQFGDQRIERAILPEQRSLTIVNQTTNVTNITYNNATIVNQGPSYDEVRSQTREPISQLRLDRQLTMQTDNPRSVVRGGAVEIPAPVIAARASERPRIIKETIAQAAVDLGWAAISNQHEAQQARAKIKSEATPPADAPPKKFVKTTESTPASAPTTTPSSTQTPPTPTATESSIVTATPSATINPSATEASSLSPAPIRATPSTPEPTVAQTPSAAEKPTATATATPRLRLSPLPTSTPRLAASESPAPSAIESPMSSATPGESNMSSPVRERTRSPSATAEPSQAPTPGAKDSTSTKIPIETPAPGETAARSTASPSGPAVKPWIRSSAGKQIENPKPAISSPSASPAPTPEE